MTNYKVTNLTEKTPRQQQEKLQTQLKTIKGVESVRVHPEKSEISMSFRQNEEPEQEAIKSAVASAGFTLGTRG